MIARNKIILLLIAYAGISFGFVDNSSEKKLSINESTCTPDNNFLSKNSITTFQLLSTIIVGSLLYRAIKTNTVVDKQALNVSSMEKEIEEFKLESYLSEDDQPVEEK